MLLRCELFTAKLPGSVGSPGMGLSRSIGSGNIGGGVPPDPLFPKEGVYPELSRNVLVAWIGELESVGDGGLFERFLASVSWLTVLEKSGESG